MRPGDMVELEVVLTRAIAETADVFVRVKLSYAIEIHIDTDEGNAKSTH